MMLIPGVQVRGVTDAGLKPRSMKCVAVLGGGLMGSGIATALALAGYSVLLKEVNQQFLDGGMGRIKSNLASRVSKQGSKEGGASTPHTRYVISTRYVCYVY